MILNWLAFFGLGVCTYIGISYFAQITGGQSSTMLQTAVAAIKPIPIIVCIIANVFFALAVYMGFKNTQFAVPATIAVGVITSALYSVVVFGASFTLTKALGIVLILLGIFLLA